MKLFGLLQEDAPLQQLDEHLGNLDSIDKELAKTLMSTHKVKGSSIGRGFKPYTYGKPGEERWEGGSERDTNKVYKKIGRDSEIVPAKLKFNEAAEEFNHDDVGAIIYKLNGKQVLIVTLTNAVNTGTRTAGYKSPLSFVWKATTSFARELVQQSVNGPLLPGTKKTFVGEFVRHTKSGDARGGTFEELKKVTELFRILAQNEWALANPTAKTMVKDTNFPELDLLIVKFDKERAAKHAERVETRKGMVPVPKTPGNARIIGSSNMATAHSAYIKELYAALKYKVNALKNKRAAGFSDPEEMLQHLLKEGYVKKIRFMDKAYDLEDSRISLDDLQKKERGTGDTYIKYKCDDPMEWSDQRLRDAAKEVEDMIEKLAGEHNDELPEWITKEADEEKRAKSEQGYKYAWAKEKVKQKAADVYLKHGVWPASLTIRLVLVGGRIEPFKIDMAFSIYG